MIIVTYFGVLKPSIRLGFT